MPVPEVIEAFSIYIKEEIPFRLIDLASVESIRLVETDAVREAYITTIAAVTEVDIERHTSYVNQRREDVIKIIVKSIVKYATLSHTWLKIEPGEVVYRDLLSVDSRPSGPGWDKLVRYCDLARESFGCRFAWADTVCNDWENPKDLQVTTESLFRWCRNAYVCIAYLAHSTTRSDIKRDPWIRSGWTLPEILAPTRMKFYGAGWKALNNDHIDNDKADRTFLASLSEASGIPVDDLRSYLPGPDRVRTKLSWASRRRTAVIEDRAYSLMAIFDARIPIDYGEGERAFSNLMLDVIPRSGECDVFAWAGPCSLSNPAIPQSPEGYREECLDRQLNADTHHYRLCGDRALSFDLDHLSLRVVTIEVTLVRRPARVAMYIPMPHSHKASINEVTLPQPPRWSTDLDEDIRMAVGVVDYGWTNHPNQGRILPGVEYFCFLLYKSSKTVEWHKVPTEKVVFLFNDQELQQELEMLRLTTSLQ
ncbi:hypothetical protein PAXRUDRAFT_827846 [Paxillus rubicundulus Ve08.2h10]|uniref:Unplaced genomic scaffold scaffold_275, whole genome shotgun sequence n=1 Tax=Paxillus rubicundulus Ve08.2h10 TaxID=930991 RepID=A0A0D0E252_9AGAM|nr:hypothetical protein PAXRUDRAFT_827846 [Paxillus rubicundulus Ve08.2h10]